MKNLETENFLNEKKMIMIIYYQNISIFLLKVFKQQTRE